MAEKPHLILHIGQGKTGSTSIQLALKNNPRVLAEAGILFPETGAHTNHQDIFTHLTGDVKHHDPTQSGPRADARKLALGRGYWEACLADIAARRPGIVVLSCENQFRPFPPEALARLTSQLAGHFASVEVTAYLRQPSSHFLSAAQQDLKKRPDFAIPSPTLFRDTLEPWLTHGPGPVSALRFSRADLVDGNVVADFCKRFLPLNFDTLDKVEDEVNTTISAEAMDVLQRYHRGTYPAPNAHYARRHQRMKALVRQADAETPGFRKPALAPGLAQAVDARARDLDWLADRFGVIFDGIETRPEAAAAAEARVAGLRDVADICALDTARAAALDAAIRRLAGADRGWRDRLRALFPG